MFKLLSTTGDQSIDLAPGRAVIVGRAVTSDVPVYDPTISRQHAELVLADGGVRIKDLGSSNGTYVNGIRVNSCLRLAQMHEGDDITTIEGLGAPEALHPMQAAFVAHDGYQCGYCTSGQIMSAVALMKEPCGPTDADVKELMSGNICRCGAYPNIVAAIQEVRGKTRVSES